MRLMCFPIAAVIALVLGLLVLGRGGGRSFRPRPPAPATLAQLWEEKRGSSGSARWTGTGRGTNRRAAPSLTAGSGTCSIVPLPLPCPPIAGRITPAWWRGRAAIAVGPGPVR